MRQDPKNEIDFLKDELFVKWVRSSDAELDLYWQRWLEQHPEKRDLLLKAKAIVESFRYDNSYSMSEGNFNKVLNNLVRFNHDANFEWKERRSAERRYPIAWAAAVALIVAVFLGVVLKTFDQKETSDGLTVQYITKVVPKGVKTTLTLPDGTIVKLNSMSSIKYPSQFEGTSREVFLTGQAFFNVTENKDAPFFVHTENFTTRVLGTSFDIRSYATEKVKHVAVVTGKVEVATINGLSEILIPDEMTIYNNNEMTRKSSFDHNAVLGWKDGLLQFNNADFNEVTEQLSRWYGVDFVVDAGLVIEGKYTGTYRNESLENVLKGIAFSSDFDFMMDEKVVRISKPSR